MVSLSNHEPQGDFMLSGAGVGAGFTGTPGSLVQLQEPHEVSRSDPRHLFQLDAFKVS